MAIRTFVAAWPPPATVDVASPSPAGLRLVPAERRHVTLRFLGDVAHDELAVVGERLAEAALPACAATVGTSATTFGRSILVVPVAGLADLAAGVVAATLGLGSHPPDERPFSGHVTLARGRDLRGFRGLAVAGGAWAVDEVTVVTSRLGTTGPRYEVAARVPLR